MGNSHPVAVIGSVNMDIGGHPFGRYLPKDSNPGRIRLSLGGVGANIARNARALGLEVEFVTAIGGDSFAELVERELLREGLGLAAALHAPEESTSTYLYVTDERGDMVSAISDMRISLRQTPDFFRDRLDFLNATRAVMLDANLSQDSLCFLAKNLRVPIFADAVSVAKAVRLRPVLRYLHTLRPNRLEAEALTGILISNPDAALRAARTLVETGLNRVLITLGADGVCYADSHTAFCIPAFPTHLKNATGAGDAFSATVLWAWTKDLPPRDTCLHALAAASIAAEDEETVSASLSLRAVKQRLKSEGFA